MKDKNSSWVIVVCIIAVVCLAFACGLWFLFTKNMLDAGDIPSTAKRAELEKCLSWV